MLLLLLALVAGVSCQELCDSCVLVNTTCYSVTHLLDLSAPFRTRIVIHKLAVLRSDNTLFYSFEPTIEDEEYYKIGFVNLDRSNETGIISSPNLVINFGTFDIDQDNGLVYLGGDDGIFILDTKANKLAPYSSRGDTINSIFFKNNVYFVKYNGLGITVKKGDNFRILLENMPIKTFVINKYDVIVFSNKYGLHVGKGESVYRISKNAYFRGLSIDLDGNVYAWWVDGIYRVIIGRELHSSRVVRVAKMPAIGAMTFDNDNNILFTSDKGLYRMTETDQPCK